MPAKKKLKKSTKRKSAVAATGMAPVKPLVDAIVQAAQTGLPTNLQGRSEITMLADGAATEEHPNRGKPGQAKPKDGVVPALDMPVDVSSLCVNAEESAHDVVCELADVRAAVVKTGFCSAYGISRVEELMRRLNSIVERLKLELKRLNRAHKA